MAEDIDIDSLKDRYSERRDKLRSFKSDIDNVLDYNTSVPVTKEEEERQKGILREDLYKLIDRIESFRTDLE